MVKLVKKVTVGKIMKLIVKDSEEDGGKDGEDSSKCSTNRDVMKIMTRRR